MPKRIVRDHSMFRDVVAGTTNRELQKYINSGQIFRQRGKGGFIGLPIPQINLPHIRFGRGDEGVGRGPGKKGDKVGEEPGKGKGKGNEAGQEPGEGMIVNVDMKSIMDALKQELELPNLRKKDSDTFEEVKIKYNGLSKVGPASLLHKRKTMLTCMKRLASTGELDQLHMLPGFREAIPILTPITDDKRYRQWNEIKIPSSNAVIFFARDISGSVDNYKCEIISDIAWWLDCYIQSFYEKVQRCYVVHDTEAKEVDEDKFYRIRMGGGTVCSTAMEYIAQQLKHRFTPEKWNVYVFYFGDGENWGDDNEKFVKTIKEKLPPEKVNLVGVTEILSYGGETLKTYLDKKLQDGTLDNNFVRSAAVIDPQKGTDKVGWGWHWNSNMSEDDRNKAIRGVLKDLLGQKKQDFAKKAAAA